MYSGLDSATNLQSQASNIKNAGYSFVCRYYNVNNPSKNLTLSEAQALSSAGLYIVPVWENGYPTSSSYFSYAKGYDDAQSALDYARNTIGQPLDYPIYFAVDYDASSTDISGVILDYFNGVAQGLNISGNPYTIGVYGSGAVCQYIYNNVGTVYYTWLAQSTGWSGYNTFTTWNIKQGGGFNFNGISCDSDTSWSSTGSGFKLS